MENTSFMRIEEVAQELGISKSYAYKIVQKLNRQPDHTDKRYGTAAKAKLANKAQKYKF